MQTITFKKKNVKLKKIVIEEIKNKGSIYLMFLPAAILLFLFNYIPLYGLIIAFKDLNFSKGIWGSDWTNPIFNNFNFLFSSDSAITAIRNTVFLNIVFIVVGLICEVGLAILLNEIRNKLFRKVTQSITLFPYFVSWIVVGVFTYNIFSTENGILNNILSNFGIDKIAWYSEAGLWPFILTVINRWKLSGYGAIIYLAVLSGIDPSYYEAAEIDRASRWQQIYHITLPQLVPTIIILTLLNVGRIMNSDFGMFYSVVGDAAQIYRTTDVIDTFVYRGLKQTGDIGMSSAAGFTQSIISFILVMATNLWARSVDKDSALF